MGSETNPFAVIFVITAILLVVTISFSFIAPSVYPDILNDPTHKYTMPPFPTLQSGQLEGNTSATWAFDETHEVLAYYNYTDFNTFNPDKEAVIGRSIPPFPDYVVIQRAATSLMIIPTSAEEPFYYTDGTAIYYKDNSATSLLNRVAYSQTQLSGQEILNNRVNDRLSTFLVDKDNPNYICYVDFTPLRGYSNLADSWNHGNGLTVRIYGNSYTQPTWIEQIVSLLAFIGQCIAFFGKFVVWLFIMAGLLSSIVLGISPLLGGAIMALVLILFVGSIFTFIRGGGTGK